MKKIISFGFLLLCTITLIKAQTHNTDEIAKLRSFLTQGSGENGKFNYQQLNIDDIQTVEWNNVQGLIWNQSGNVQEIRWNSKNLSGDLDLGNFTGLKKIHCEYNAIRSVNVTGCTELSYMDCYNNQLQNVNLKTNLKLDSFCCRYNQLKEVDLTKNIKLIYFCGSGNQFEYMDLSNNPELTTFYCANNQLKSIDFSNNPKLRRTYLRTNQLTQLDFSGNKQLRYVTCYENLLTTLDLSGCTLLDTIFCYENQLETINLTGCNALKYITVRDNKLKEIDALDCKELKTLVCQNNRLESLKLGTDNMTVLYCEGNRLTLSSLPHLSAYEAYNYSPQADVSLSSPSDKIDLSDIYLINGIASHYSWTDKNGTPVNPVQNTNGLFSFDRSLASNTLNCKITNSGFPDLTMDYHVTLTSPVANESVDKKYAVYSKDGKLHLKTQKPVTTKIYAISGTLVHHAALDEGESVFSLPSGFYIISLDNQYVQKVMVR